jgi:hypothetical protein
VVRAATRPASRILLALAKPREAPEEAFVFPAEIRASHLPGLLVELGVLDSHLGERSKRSSHAARPGSRRNTALQCQRRKRERWPACRRGPYERWRSRKSDVARLKVSGSSCSPACERWSKTTRCAAHPHLARKSPHCSMFPKPDWELECKERKECERAEGEQSNAAAIDLERQRGPTSPNSHRKARRSFEPLGPESVLSQVLRVVAAPPHCSGVPRRIDTARSHRASPDERLIARCSDEDDPEASDGRTTPLDVRVRTCARRITRHELDGAETPYFERE